jgi:hypothetical protein
MRQHRTPEMRQHRNLEERRPQDRVSSEIHDRSRSKIQRDTQEEATTRWTLEETARLSRRAGRREQGERRRRCRASSTTNDTAIGDQNEPRDVSVSRTSIEKE